jgi:hypothetical protein
MTETSLAEPGAVGQLVDAWGGVPVGVAGFFRDRHE